MAVLQPGGSLRSGGGVATIEGYGAGRGEDDFRVPTGCFLGLTFLASVPRLCTGFCPP